MSPTDFEAIRTSDKRLLSRTTALRRGGYLTEYVFSKSCINFQVDDFNGSIVRVLAKPPLRFYIPSRGWSEEALGVAAQFLASYAIMEIDDQPSSGWPVELEAQYCPCRYHFKMRDCVHLQFALQCRNYVARDGERLMVIRSRNRGLNVATSDGLPQTVGRPRHAGHALHWE
ncbi:hypothetical protein GN244_ATG16940 [Phytophthora infestans]|uniref:SWIM-type domain-containing protein n=1 Tax=Phytophthora infestans TaxID=4787 RepID=A0A833W416_PHYIN|nr:hypothetical protein GN244_ATG19517 [Phytophthora infestans]KAF4031212.1 hypothetical protein GN244_ATG16940 [Phytophthora infestans]